TLSTLAKPRRYVTMAIEDLVSRGGGPDASLSCLCPTGGSVAASMAWGRMHLLHFPFTAAQNTRRDACKSCHRDVLRTGPQRSRHPEWLQTCANRAGVRRRLHTRARPNEPVCSRTTPARGDGLSEDFRPSAARAALEWFNNPYDRRASLLGRG